MALVKSFNFKGIEVPNAYHVVGYVKYSKIDNQIMFRLDSFVNEEQRIEKKKEPFLSEGYRFIPSGSYSTVGNDISTACYTYLKTLSTWSDAVDS